MMHILFMNMNNDDNPRAALAPGGYMYLDMI